MVPRSPKAFAIRDPFAWNDFSAVVRHGESLGYWAVFLPEIAGRDSLGAMSALASETNRLTLASGIVPMTSRSPFLTAMAAATAHERSDGRAILGIGTGAAVQGALGRLEEQVRDLRLWLSGREANGRQLSLQLPSTVPIWISALGPNAMRLAGRAADGVILNWCTPERVATARGEIAKAAEDAGRDPGEVTIAVYIRANVEASAAAALRAAAAEYASYPAYARQFELMGLGDLADRATTAHKEGRSQDVPDSFVNALAITDREKAPQRIAEYRQAGADLPVIYPVAAGPDPVGAVTSTLVALAEA